MPRHAETRRLPYTPEQLFDLVSDVGRYPEFLPWIMATRIRSRGPKGLVADLVVGFKAFRETFTSRVALERPERVRVDYVEGPLRYLRNEWRFRPDGQGGTLVDFAVDFEFRSRILDKAASAVFGQAVKRAIAAFENRAAALYASSSPSANSTA